jgi:hypothetical protein
MFEFNGSSEHGCIHYNENSIYDSHTKIIHHINISVHAIVVFKISIQDTHA